MERYEKPVVTVDVGLAEGVYAASGAGNSVSAGSLSVVADWGGSGQAMFTLDMSNANRSRLKLRPGKDIYGGAVDACVTENPHVLAPDLASPLIRVVVPAV